jgi:hypothetical protein
MSKLNNDVGLLRVDQDIVFNDFVQPMELPNEDFSKKNYPAILTGWGSTKVRATLGAGGGTSSPRLLIHLNCPLRSSAATRPTTFRRSSSR